MSGEYLCRNAFFNRLPDYRQCAAERRWSMAR